MFLLSHHHSNVYILSTKHFFLLFVFLLLNIYLISTVICLDYSEVKSLSVRKHSRKTSRKSLMLTCVLSIRAPFIPSNCLSHPTPLLPPPFISQWGKWKCVVAQSCPTLCDPMDSSFPGSCPWDSPGKNSEVSCHFLLQGIFPTQRLNPHLYHLLHWQADSLHAEPSEKLKNESV